jgi:hypothetical protein
MSQPNILLIMTDEHAPMYSGTYGHPLVQTPCLDQLAACLPSTIAVARPKPSPCIAPCPVIWKPSWRSCRPPTETGLLSQLHGVYVQDGDGIPFFVPAPSLTNDDVRGLFEAGSTNPLWEQEPLLAQISATSVQGMVAYR